eukprot:4271091-Amphidinium_carterae.1
MHQPKAGHCSRPASSQAAQLPREHQEHQEITCWDQIDLKSGCAHLPSAWRSAERRPVRS